MEIPVQPKVDENRSALAPYNFIPLPEKVITISVDDLPDQGIYDTNLHTGYLDCTLTTSSPVYVRAGLRPEEANANKESKDQPDFFYLNDKDQPVIPGSSLRGMLRTLVEIVTFSKISAVSKSPLVYRSVGGTTNHDENYRKMMMHLDHEEKSGKNTKFYTPLMKGGYMVQIGPKDWAIQPAKTIDGTTYAHIGIDEEKFHRLKRIPNCQNAFEIYIQTGPYQYQDVREGFLKIKFSKVTASGPASRPGLRSATLSRSGKMMSKKSEAVVYERDEKAAFLVLSDEKVTAYQEQISKEQEKLLGKYGALNDGQPVFYLEKEGKVVFFGHARMFRVPYPHSPFDYVPEYARTEDEPKDATLVDMAEAIFGYTRKVKDGFQKQRAYAGRVFFGDATLNGKQNDIWLSNASIIPKILSGPKPTTFQHYLVQSDLDSLDNGKPYLHDFASKPVTDTVIRGHKFYWNKGEVGLNDIKDNKVSVTDSQHAEIRPLKAGISFKFQIRFENLTDEELGAILWILNIAADDKIRLKLGMGKPLGMGAIQIRAQLFEEKPDSRYASLLDKQTWAGVSQENPRLSDLTIAKYITMMDRELSSEFMRHPRVHAFLTMLQWPGPNKEWTRYMEIEHLDPKEKRGKKNEYRDRPVLPTPASVLKNHKP
jgi:CRISPR-associated protein (TIGR03986 family)